MVARQEDRAAPRPQDDERSYAHQARGPDVVSAASTGQVATYQLENERDKEPGAPDVVLIRRAKVGEVLGFFSLGGGDERQSG